MAFRFPAGKYRGKPATEYDAYGLPILTVVTTPYDDARDFSKEYIPPNDEEYCAMFRRSECGLPILSGDQALKIVQKNSATCSDSTEICVDCFANTKEWPGRCNVKCWWCFHTFDTRPFPCPINSFSDEHCRTVYRVRGVFCGPSCAKAWAATAMYKPNMGLIDQLAYCRGFGGGPDAKKKEYIPKAPPREALADFCGEGGLSIEQFRKLCALGMDVTILNPPFITQKQVLVGRHDNQNDMANKYGKSRTMHVESFNDLAMSGEEIAKRKRAEGMEIFAGIGTRRLTDFFPTAAVASATHAHVQAPPTKKPRLI